MEISQTSKSRKTQQGRLLSRASKLQQVLYNLPQGVRFVGKPDLLNATFLSSQDNLSGAMSRTRNQTSLASISKQSELSENIVLAQGEFLVGLFAITLNQVSKKGLQEMRNLLPRDEYRRLKDRKHHRMVRKARREKLSALLSQNQFLREQNEQLQRMLEARTNFDAVALEAEGEAQAQLQDNMMTEAFTSFRSSPKSQIELDPLACAIPTLEEASRRLIPISVGQFPDEDELISQKTFELLSPLHANQAKLSRD